jgi:predicted deacetylase
MINKKTLIIDFDDYHWRDPENCLNTLRLLIEEIPEIKISLFTIPNLDNQYLSKDERWCHETKKLIYSDNICLGVHGYTHTPLEFENLSYQDAKHAIQLAEAEFTFAKLPFAKVFKGPHWGLAEPTLRALEVLKYTHIFTHEDYRYLEKQTTLQNVFYNWNLKDEPKKFKEMPPIITAHGHTHNVCNNGITEIAFRLVEFIGENRQNINFEFITFNHNS